ncbi:MAG: chemotaxis protein CheW, partial [Planctomycetota bacterium]
NLVELLRVGSEDALGIEEVFGQRVFRLRGDLLDLVDLNDQLGTESTCDSQECSIVVVQASGRSFGLVVDGIYESEEIVVKPLERVVKSLHAYAGTTILADGQVALILDIAGLAQRAQLLSEDELERAARKTQGRNGGPSRRSGANAPVEYLVTSVGDGRRIAMELSRVDRLEDINPKEVESAGYQNFVQYRGELLQLIDVGEILGSGRAADPDRRVWKTIVRTHNGMTYGLVVMDVVDILEVSPAAERRDSPDAAVGAVLVIGGKVTEMIDENWLATCFGQAIEASDEAPENVDAEGAAISLVDGGSTRSLVQLCTFRLGGQLYGINVLDVQEVLMPHQRTPIPLSPPEVEGLLNLRGDTVLSVDLAVLLGLSVSGQTLMEVESGSTPPSESIGDAGDRMNVVLRTSQGSMSMLVDEVGEVMDLPESLFEPCPSNLSPAQSRVALGVFKLESDLLIQLDVENLYGLVADAHLIRS